MESNVTSITQSLGNTKILSVTIKRPDRVVFTGNVKAITSSNMRGPFDVLPFHSNFISLIKDYVIIHHENNQPSQLFKLQAGIIKVTGNTVSVLVGIETRM